MKYKKAIFGVIALLFLLIVVVTITQPLLIKAIMVKYKSTDHFLILEEDVRIRYEKSAKKNALTLARVLSDSQNKVESILKASFEKPIEVYVCSSQKIFNEYVFLSKNASGAVYWEKVFLSPRAFRGGSLGHLMVHELTHYFFSTHLGERAHMRDIPLWFREGIATFAANGGAEYTIGNDVYSLMNNKAKEAYLSGEINYWFFSNDPRDAVTKDGVANGLLYQVGASFVHFIHDSAPDHFDKLIQLLLAGNKFDHAVQSSFDQTIDLLLNKFTDYLIVSDRKPILENLLPEYQ